MSDIVAFLRARLAEEQQVAEWAGAHHLGADDEDVWAKDAGGSGIGYVRLQDQSLVADVSNRGGFGGVGWYTAEHMANWDPARVLAGCRALNALIDYEIDAAGEYGALSLQTRHRLQLLASPYQAHPDYDPAWAL